MRILEAADVTFRKVMFADAQTIFFTNYNGSQVFYWNLAQPSPQPLTELDTSVFPILTRCGSQNYLRHHRLWPPREAYHTPEYQLALDPQRRKSLYLVALAPDARSVLLRATVNTRDFYGTQFYYWTPDRMLLTYGTSQTTIHPRGDFSPNGERMAMTGGSEIVALSTIYKTESIHELRHQQRVLNLRFVSDTQLAVAAGKVVYLWDFSTGQVQFRFPPFQKFVEELAVTPDGRWLIAGGRDGVVRVWNTATGAERACFDWKLGEILGLDCSPDGSTAVAIGPTQAVLWDIE